MDDLRNAALISVFAASIMGSPHCSAMCGGFTMLYAKHSKNRPAAHLLYSLGRLTTYSALGLSAALLGKTLDALTTIGNFAALITGILLLISGTLQLIGIENLFSKIIHKESESILGKLAKKLYMLDSIAKPFLIGLVTTLLPCGWLYTFVALALASADPIKGLLIMFIFWLGTLPVMIFTGVFSQKLSGFVGRFMPRLAAVLVILAGLFSIYSHINHADHGISHHEHSGH